MQRNTRQRKMVLDAVRARHDHPSADDIYLDVRAKDNSISRGTVYRNLNNLSDEGEILRVCVPGMQHYDYLLEKHCHILCKSCGKVFDVPVPYDETLDDRVREATGFEVQRHRTVFEGICPECADRKKKECR